MDRFVYMCMVPVRWGWTDYCKVPLSIFIWKRCYINAPLYFFFYAKKSLDGQTKGKIASQNIFQLPKQILIALQFFFLFHALIYDDF